MSWADSNAFEEVEISVEVLEDPSIDAMLDAFRGVYANGDARFASFLIGPHRFLDGSALQNRLDDIGFWPPFLGLEAVARELAWLGKIALDGVDGGFEPMSSFILDGDLARTLMAGGAYSSRRFPGTADEAKRLCLDFCSVLFDGRWNEVIVRTTSTAWASWFMGTPWDRTWLGFDRTARRVWLLCVTDTD